MAKLSEKIEGYCAENGIQIPPGFYRRSASRYVIVVQVDGSEEKKLIARTWFKVADVIYYLDNFATDAQCQIFDFQNMLVLKREGDSLAESSVISFQL